MRRYWLIVAILVLWMATVAYAAVQSIPTTSGGIDATAAKNYKVYQGINFTAATTEAMITLTPATDWVNGSTGTSFTVTSGKRLVLLGMSCVTKNAGAAAQGVIVRLRVSASGVAATTSPAAAVCGAGTLLATANIVNGMAVQLTQAFPTIVELSGTQQVGISQIGTATAGNDVTLWGYEY